MQCKRCSAGYQAGAARHSVAAALKNRAPAARELVESPASAAHAAHNSAAALWRAPSARQDAIGHAALRSAARGEEREVTVRAAQPQALRRASPAAIARCARRRHMSGRWYIAVGAQQCTASRRARARAICAAVRGAAAAYAARARTKVMLRGGALRGGDGGEQVAW